MACLENNDEFIMIHEITFSSGAHQRNYVDDQNMVINIEVMDIIGILLHIDIIIIIPIQYHHPHHPPPHTWLRL